jgi:fatty acid-binding protein DegV
MMSRTALVTGSISDFFLYMIRGSNINVVSLTIRFDDEIYIDMVELTSAQFFEELRASRVMPMTCQPSPAEFVEAYEGLVPEAIEVIDGQAVGTHAGRGTMAVTWFNSIVK